MPKNLIEHSLVETTQFGQIRGRKASTSLTHPSVILFLSGGKTLLCAGRNDSYGSALFRK